jgi:hypothetical protein
MNAVNGGVATANAADCLRDVGNRRDDYCGEALA